MKIRITRLVMAAAIAAVMVVAGNGVARAQSCPTSPNFSPDFTSNETCLTMNGFDFQTAVTAPPGPPGFYPVITPPPAPPVVSTVLRLTPNQVYWAGSAWYNTPQPVSGAFSSTFTFEISGNGTPADGIAFVIQNSPAGTTALGPEGCGIGFGGSTGGCTPYQGPQTGITNSLAVELNTYMNAEDQSGNDVQIQTCLTAANSVDQSCTIAINSSLNLLPVPITLSDGNPHTMIINYSGPSTKLLDVILDGNDLFPGGVVFDMTTIGLNSGNAWVGFTGATGGDVDNQDILSWTFTPGSQTAVISTTAPTVLSFPNASGNNVYDYNAQLTTPYANPVLEVQPYLLTAAACDALVQVNFWPARCFVYQNAENTGLDMAVIFAVTCPDSPGGTCGSAAEQNFFATLGTDFSFLYSDNPLFIYRGIDSLLNPLPGWVKWPLPSPPTALFPISPPAKGSMSNQIASFSVVQDPGGKTLGGSGGGASYWVATYDMPDEVGPGLQAGPGIKITSPISSKAYAENTVVAATYTCGNPSTSQPLSSPTGPYLTAASCTQAIGTQTSCTFTPIVGPGNLGGLSCTGTFVTPGKKGTYVFGVTGIDSGGNQNLGAVTYKVN